MLSWRRPSVEPETLVGRPRAPRRPHTPQPSEPYSRTGGAADRPLRAGDANALMVRGLVSGWAPNHQAPLPQAGGAAERCISTADANALKARGRIACGGLLGH